MDDDGPASGLLSPVRAVARHASRFAPDPVLIFPAAGEWRWRSWGWLRAAAAAVSERLGDLGGREVTFRARPGPWIVAVDLGILAAGGVSRPVWGASGEGLPTEGTEHLLSSSGEGPEAIPFATLDEEAKKGRHDGGPSVEGSGAAVSVVGPRGREVWDPGESERRIRELDGRIGRGRGRDVVLVAGSLADPTVRVTVAWALARGGCLALVPSSAELVADLLWIRPTVACFSPGELETVDRELPEEGSIRSVRRRLGRWRVVVVGGGDQAHFGRVRLPPGLAGVCRPRVVRLR